MTTIKNGLIKFNACIDDGHSTNNETVRNLS